jgi:hypothetical protein
MRHLGMADFENAYRAANGNAKKAAKALGVPPDDFLELAMVHPALIKISFMADMHMIDDAISNVREAINDPTDAARRDSMTKFLLQTPLASYRGFSSREVRGELVATASEKQPTVFCWIDDILDPVEREAMRKANPDVPLEAARAARARRAIERDPNAAVVEPDAVVETVAAIVEPDEILGPNAAAALEEPIIEEPTPKPDVDLAAIHAERFRLLRDNLGNAEARARAYDHAVKACCDHYGVDLEAAKRAVQFALAGHPPTLQDLSAPRSVFVSPSHRSDGR